MVGDDIIAH